MSKGIRYADKLALSLVHYADALMEQGRVYPAGTMKMAADRIEQQISRIAELESALAAERARVDTLAEALTKYSNRDHWNQRDMRTGHFSWFMLGNAGWDIADAALSDYRTARGK